MDFDSFFKNLGLKTPDKCFEGTFLSALEEYRKDGVFFLNTEYIDYVNSFGNCISNCIDEVKVAVEEAGKKADVSLYMLFLWRAMAEKEAFSEHISEFVFPEGDEVEIRLLPFVVLITEIPALYEKFKKRRVPDDVIAQTLRQFEDCVYLTEERTGKTGYLKRYFDHMLLYPDEKILNIGRLRFQMVPELESDVSVLESEDGEIAVLFDGAKINSAGRLFGTPPKSDNKEGFVAWVTETDDSFIGYRADRNGNCDFKPQKFPKEKWHRILGKGDPVLSVHIPSVGSFTKEVCEESYRRAREIFKACYPEFEYKAFHCHSWMLDPQLEAFLSEASNVLAFQRKFIPYAGESEGTEVFNFVFKMTSKVVEEIPEDTSLQRALKKLYLDSKYIYEYEGVFTNEQI